MADVPKSLLSQIKDFEDLFTVDTAKLKEIVAHFVEELEKGRFHFCFILLALIAMKSVTDWFLLQNV